MPTARVVDELWGERPPATAVKTVQVFVSQLRKVLGDGVLETAPGGYLVRVAPGALDSRRFEGLLEQGRSHLAEGEVEEAAEALREALRLWRGPALADFQYESFARNEIGRLEELRVVGLELRLEAELALGRHAEVVGELEALVRDQPLRERPLGLLMRALYRSGRQADALAAYQEARTRLVDELGLDPGQVLQELEKAILRQDPALDLPALPPPPRRRPEAPPPASAEPTSEGRKTVTVLFCELDPGKELDPESLRLVTSRFLAEVTGVVESHGGKLDELAGGEVMAVFGVPVVREDDSMRAVRAALELRGLGPAVRLGVNTGEVITGDHGDITGFAVAAGKHLAHRAASGEILLGETTYAAVAHAAEVTPRGDAVYVLQSLDPEATAVPRRDDARFVGRDRELVRLRELYARVVAGEGSGLVTIVGEPGIGKSRLAREALARLTPEPTLLVGRCPPYGEGVTFWPLRELLRQAGRDGELSGSSHEVFATVRQLLVELAEDRPVVVAFDDIHWAEPTFLDLVEYLAARLGEARVLLVCLTRPQLGEQRPTWLQPPAELLLLEPLSDADTELLLESLGAPPALRARIAETAEGNPLFVEQLAAITDESAATVVMPGSIRGVLHERLDRLDRAERAVLERAAVAGRSFSLGAVIDLSPPEEANRVNERLLSLVRKRFVRPDPIAPDEGFRFQHALIRDAAYDGMPKAVRADLHAQTAERLTTQRVDDALIGYHLEQVFLLRRDLGSGDPEVGANAFRRLRAAAHDAFARSDVPAAISLFERARAVVGEDAPELPSVLTELSYAQMKVGDFVAAERHAAEAVDLAARSGDRNSELPALIERQFARSWISSEDSGAENERVAVEAMTELDQLGNDHGLARAWWLKADGDLRACRWRARVDALEHALVHARRATPQLDLVSTLSGLLAQALLHGPTHVAEAVARVEKLLEAAGDPALRATVSTSLAGLLAMQGRFDEAHRLYAEAAATFDELGLTLRRATHALVGAEVEILSGNFEAAEDLLRVARKALGVAGARAVDATTAAVLAEVLCRVDRLDEAEALAHEAAEAAPADDLGTQALWRSALGRVLARRDALEEATRLVDEALAITEDVEFPHVRVAALAAAAEVASAGGRADDARLLIQQACRVASEKGNVAALGPLQFAEKLD